MNGLLDACRRIDDLMDDFLKKGKADGWKMDGGSIVVGWFK